MEVKPEDIKAFCFSEDFKVTSEIKETFKKYGYIIVRGLFDKEEMDMLKTAIEKSKLTEESNSFERDDGEGLKIKTVLWTTTSEDITGMAVRCEKLAGTVEELLGGEVYPYHIKLSLKDAFTGGSWIWHQDYGYWYEDGCIFPNMATAYVALDKATKENGCLKVLVGSHLAGRVDHVPIGEQIGADLDRVDLLSKRLPLLHAELEQGDVFIFHCNMLHRSDQNHSAHRRWGFLGSYNRADNNPTCTDIPGAQSFKMEKVPNSALKSATTKVAADGLDLYHHHERNQTSFSKLQNKKKEFVQMKVGQ